MFHTPIKVNNKKLLYTSPSKFLSNWKAEVKENYIFARVKFLIV